MSADVQPRKRKDKKKKRDSLDKSEGDIFARKLSLKDDEEVKESHHGVHATKMGADDVHLHIQAEHATGGHWCAKVFFFSLLAILLGLIGLIIIENRGLSDLDTPLSESRYSEYFEGWVDEHRQSHDDHKMPPELEDHGAEPFEEEEDHSEMDDDEGHVDEPAEDQDDGIDDQDDEDTAEKATVDELSNEEEDEQDVDDVETEDKDEIETDEKVNEADNDDADEGFEDADADDNGEESLNNDADEEDNNDQMHITTEARMSEKTNEDAYDEDEDDDFDSVEHVVNNDADEEQRLKKVIEEQERAEKLLLEREKQEEEENESSSMSLKVFVGVALAFVARLVLIRNSESSTKIGSGPSQEDPIVSMRRRLTMITAEEPIPVDHDERVDDLEEEYLDEEEFEEEEVEYCEEEQIVVEKYVPETFEQMHAMYRSKESEHAKASGIEDLRAKVEDIKPKLKDAQPRLQEIKQTIQDIKPKIENIAVQSAERNQTTVEKFPELAAKIPQSHVEITTEKMSQSPLPSFMIEQSLNKTENQEQEENAKEIDDLGEEEEEEIDEEELGSEEEEVSDVDDDELMLRLEAKYGKLPQRQYDSDEDDDLEEDNSWTKINPRSAGGAQSYSEDDYIEEELRRANEDMLQNQFDFQ